MFRVSTVYIIAGHSIKHLANATTVWWSRAELSTLKDNRLSLAFGELNLLLRVNRPVTTRGPDRIFLESV